MSSSEYDVLLQEIQTIQDRLAAIELRLGIRSEQLISPLSIPWGFSAADTPAPAAAAVASVDRSSSGSAKGATDDNNKKTSEEQKTPIQLVDEVLASQKAGAAATAAAAEIESVWDAVEVIPGLYVGGQLAAMSLSILLDRKIAFVLNAAEEVSCFFSSRITYLHLRMQDSILEQIDTKFGSACEFIDLALAKEKGVLVHCRAGISRSVTLVLAYLMLRKGMRLQEAFLLIAAKRPTVCPNMGFWTKLSMLDVKLFRPTEAAAAAAATAASCSDLGPT